MKEKNQKTTIVKAKELKEGDIITDNLYTGTVFKILSLQTIPNMGNHNITSSKAVDMVLKDTNGSERYYEFHPEDEILKIITLTTILKKL